MLLSPGLNHRGQRELEQAGAQQGWVSGLTEPCRQIHGRSSWISISLAEEEEGGGRGRKEGAGR